MTGFCEVWKICQTSDTGLSSVSHLLSRLPPLFLCCPHFLGLQTGIVWLLLCRACLSPDIFLSLLVNLSSWLLAPWDRPCSAGKLFQPFWDIPAPIKWWRIGIEIGKKTLSQRLCFDLSKGSKFRSWLSYRPSCVAFSKLFNLLKALLPREPQMWGTSQWAAQLLRGSGGPGLQEWNLPSVSSVQSLSRVRLFATPWVAARQDSLSITNSRSSLKLTSIKSVMPSSYLIFCRPLLLPPIPPSIRVFSNESTLHMRWPKYWNFSFSISPSNEHPGLISFRMDWLQKLIILCCIKPQTQVSLQTLLTQNPQRWDPGIHIFESSPGDSRVQLWLRACTLSSRPGWPTNPLPVSLLSYSWLCLWCLLLQCALYTCSVVTLSGMEWPQQPQTFGVHINTAQGDVSCLDLMASLQNDSAKAGLLSFPSPVTDFSV